MKRSVPMTQTRPELVGREWKIRQFRQPDLSPFVITETPRTILEAKAICKEYRELGYLCEYRDYRKSTRAWKVGIVVLVNPYPEERTLGRPLD